EADAWPMDIARYGDFTSNREYIRQTTGQFYSRRFVMTYPNEQLPAGRPLRKAPTYDAMTTAGAQWGCSWGLEVPLVFAPPGFSETPSLNRSNAFPLVAEECAAVREGVGLLDISGFSRYEISGANAEAWLDRLMASRLPPAGRARLAPMLAPSGRLKGDLTIINWGEGNWWIMGSYYLRNWHMRWFQDHLEDGVTVRDISDATIGFGLAGPGSRDVLAGLTHQDVSHDAFGFMGCQELDVGLIRSKVVRLSVCGELGYEINCSALEHTALREMLLKAGRDQGIREFGFYAMNALRLEKSFGIWSAEFTQDRTPAMTGMDRWVDWTKTDFIGRDAALEAREKDNALQRLVTLEIDADNADASGYEPVWFNDKRVGFTTSGGYGHHTGKSLAMALVDRYISDDAELSVHVVGKLQDAQILTEPAWDPLGQRMRA
ncbi:MAG: glycine cleavage T C-terminal barrel domain-containing protein, partial [Pseudomonadota bacterium]|nr:glycine cleavage T C-terminal barrel domain-containing protein [Pseudomonadota bacterium]